MASFFQYTTWVEISRRAYLHNLQAFRRLVGPAVELTTVIKANAYGHGWKPIAALAREGGIRSFAVHSLAEA
ncbi:MAG TPA: alanine racemase, partial [Calditrichae bacterium]|nr:alanine racemase [Calditrichia bacterium]